MEAITDEAKLQKITLRLEQAQLPRYAQIRHGPLEYGKDIVAVFERGGRQVLRMWQAKIGDITMPKWRESRTELEEMYLVPLASLQIAVDIDEGEGILVCNGHANPNVEPVMAGWFRAILRSDSLPGLLVITPVAVEKGTKAEISANFSVYGERTFQ